MECPHCAPSPLPSPLCRQSSLQAMVGTRCSAPFTQAWGQLEYHAAVIEDIDDASLETATTTQEVMVGLCAAN